MTVTLKEMMMTISDGHDSNDCDGEDDQLTVVVNCNSCYGIDIERRMTLKNNGNSNDNSNGSKNTNG